MKEKKNLLRKAVVAVIVLVILIPCSVLVYETSQTKDEISAFFKEEFSKWS